MGLWLARPGLLGLAAAGLAMLALMPTLFRGREAPARQSSSSAVAALLWVILLLILVACALLSRGRSGFAALALLGLTSMVGLLVAARRTGPLPAGSGLGRLMSFVGYGTAVAAIALLIGRPQWRSASTEWEKPLLVLLIDQSRSMSIVDDRESDAARSRAERAAEQISAARSALKDLEAHFELRIAGFGGAVVPFEQPDVRADQPRSAIAAALHSAGAMRSSAGSGPSAVLLITDGAETDGDAQAVVEAAAGLAARETALAAFGVGAARGPVAILLDAIAAPASVGSKDRVAAGVSGSLYGADRALDLAVDLRWNDAPESGEASARSGARVEPGAARFESRLEIMPPGSGPHVLIARVRLPSEMGGGVFERSTLVDVRDDRIRVLIVDGQPRSETAFIARALQSDARFDVSQELRLAASSGIVGPDIDWLRYDAILLGAIEPGGLRPAECEALASAVRTQGRGLALVGGRVLLGNDRLIESNLQDVVPGVGEPAPAEGPGANRLHPTPEGARHAVLRSIESGESTWQGLPNPGGFVPIGSLKPLASVLARDDRGSAALAAHDVGAGRCLMAGWEATWPWALASDAGFEMHRRMWRQLVGWLANRKPQAWVFAERPQYSRDALSSGQAKITVRAGVTETARDRGDGAGWAGRLRIEPDPATESVGGDAGSGRTSAAIEGVAAAAGPAIDIPLQPRGDDWVGELSGAAAAGLPAGNYLVRFEATRSAGADAGAVATALTATARVRITHIDAEFVEPTSNLAILRAAAERTRAAGGEYASVEQFPEVVRRWAAQDRRRRIERTVDSDPIEDWTWPLLGVAVCGWMVDWSIRRRSGLR